MDVRGFVFCSITDTSTGPPKHTSINKQTIFIMYLKIYTILAFVKYYTLSLFHEKRAGKYPARF